LAARNRLRSRAVLPPPNFTGSTGWLILIESIREIAAVDFGLGFTPPRGIDETAAGEISDSAR
jgi:hypothetical protein